MPQRVETSLSRADDLAHELQVEIITGRIPMGTRLRQEDLAARFGVSRTPIREALRQLQAIGLVEQLGHRGALVRSFHPTSAETCSWSGPSSRAWPPNARPGRLTTYDLADLQTAQSLLRAGYERHARLARQRQPARGRSCASSGRTPTSSSTT